MQPEEKQPAGPETVGVPSTESSPTVFSPTTPTSTPSPIEPPIESSPVRPGGSSTAVPDHIATLLQQDNVELHGYDTPTQTTPVTTIPVEPTPEGLPVISNSTLHSSAAVPEQTPSAPTPPAEPSASIAQQPFTAPGFTASEPAVRPSVTPTIPTIDTVQPAPTPTAAGPAVSADTSAPLPPVVPSPTKKKLSKRWLFVGVIIAAVLILGGAAAFAYTAVVLPNQPENVLKKAVDNALQTKRASVKGTASIDAATLSSKFKFDAYADVESQVAKAAVTFSMSGVGVPVEYRQINDVLYIKIGDLSQVKPILLSYLGEYASLYGDLIDTVEAKITDRWISIDSSLLDDNLGDTGTACRELTTYSLSDADREGIIAALTEHQFITTKNTSSEAVEGVDSFKYELSIDGDQAKAFAASETLQSIPFFKKFNDCMNTSDDTSASDQLDSVEAQLSSYTLTVWVSKDAKQFNRISASITGGEGDQAGTGTIDAIIGYDAQTVEEPSDATPIQTLIAELQTLFYGDYTDTTYDTSLYNSLYELEGTLQ